MTARKLDRRPGRRPEQLGLADARAAFATQLVEAQRVSRMTVRDFASQLNVSHAVVSYWRMGKCSPGDEFRASLLTWAQRHCPDNVAALQASLDALPPAGTRAPNGTKPSITRPPLRLVKTPPGFRVSLPTPSVGAPAGSPDHSVAHS